MAEDLIVGAVQMCSGISPEQNLSTISQMAEQAASMGIKYLLTPEMSVSFAENFRQLAELARPFQNNRAVAECARIARQNGLFLHVGSLAILIRDENEPESETRFANRSVLFDPNGEIVDFYDKVHLFDAMLAGDRPYEESRHYRAGRRLVLCNVQGTGLGMSICYDLRFAALYRELARAGAQIISVPAAFTVPTGRDHWEILLRARAIETGCYVVAAAQGGQHENGRSTYGHSMIIDPWGRIVRKIDGDESGIIFARIDPEEIRRVREAVPALANEAMASITGQIPARDKILFKR